jgi:hypothetical protein
MIHANSAIKRCSYRFSVVRISANCEREEPKITNFNTNIINIITNCKLQQRQHQLQHRHSHLRGVGVKVGGHFVSPVAFLSVRVTG